MENTLMKRICAVLIPLLLLTAVSADARRQAPPKQMGYAGPAQWTGFYVGAQLGEAWNESNLEFHNANYYNTMGSTLLGNQFPSDTNGLAGGGFLGYNY